MPQLEDASDCSESNEESIANTLELWTDETIEIQTPFSKSLDDIDCLRLEVAELKQIIVTLAEKFKLSEDKRKVAERRNTFLKNDNTRLQELSEICLRQKCEAVVDLEITLNKMKEFISYKDEFERKAMLLQNIISRLPKRKNASTNTETSSGGLEEAVNEEDQSSKDLTGSIAQESTMNVITESDSLERLNENKEKCARLVEVMEICNWTRERMSAKLEANVTKVKDILLEPKNSAEELADQLEDVQNEEMGETKDQRRFKLENRNNYKPKKCIEAGGDYCKEIVSSNVSFKMNKLKQEILALKNLNEWKTHDLEFKRKELACKIRELDQANKDISNLKGVINKLQADRAKRSTKPLGVISQPD